jgi:hypothetical protein
MRNPVKEKGRQVSFLNEGQEKITCLDLMKQKIGSSKGLRGEVKATAQWLMYCMVHNIEKLWKNSEVESWPSRRY